MQISLFPQNALTRLYVPDITAVSYHVAKIRDLVASPPILNLSHWRSVWLDVQRETDDRSARHRVNDKPVPYCAAPVALTLVPEAMSATLCALGTGRFRQKQKLLTDERFCRWYDGFLSWDPQRHSAHFQRSLLQVQPNWIAIERINLSTHSFEATPLDRNEVTGMHLSRWLDVLDDTGSLERALFRVITDLDLVTRPKAKMANEDAPLFYRWCIDALVQELATTNPFVQLIKEMMFPLSQELFGVFTDLCDYTGKDRTLLLRSWKERMDRRGWESIPKPPVKLHSEAHYEEGHRGWAWSTSPDYSMQRNMQEVDLQSLNGPMDTAMFSAFLTDLRRKCETLEGNEELWQEVETLAHEFETSDIAQAGRPEPVKSSLAIRDSPLNDYQLRVLSILLQSGQYNAKEVFGKLAPAQLLSLQVSEEDQEALQEEIVRRVRKAPLDEIIPRLGQGLHWAMRSEVEKAILPRLKKASTPQLLGFLPTLAERGLAQEILAILAKRKDCSSELLLETLRAATSDESRQPIAVALGKRTDCSVETVVKVFEETQSLWIKEALVVGLRERVEQCSTSVLMMMHQHLGRSNSYQPIIGALRSRFKDLSVHDLLTLYEQSSYQWAHDLLRKELYTRLDELTTLLEGGK